MKTGDRNLTTDWRKTPPTLGAGEVIIAGRSASKTRVDALMTRVSIFFV